MLSAHSFFTPSSVTGDVSKVVIRLAEMQDAKEISQVAIQTFAETYGEAAREQAERLYGSNYVNTVFPTLLKDKNNIIAVIQKGSAIIGFAKLTVQNDGIGLLDKLYILQAHHRKGYGRNLLQFSYQKAVEHGLTQGKLLVYEKNSNAIQFYEKHGFIVTEERECFLLPDGSSSGIFNLVMRADNIQNILNIEQTILKVR